MAVLLQAPYNQFLDDDGNPLTGGFVYTYDAGTDTPRATYTSYTGLIPASNPVELDAAGRADIWLSGSYKITVTDANGVVIRTVDHIEAIDQGGDMTKAVYDPANIAQQLVGISAVQTVSNKTLIAIPSLTFSSTSGIVGTTTNNNAAAGSVGQLVSASVLLSSAVALTTNVTTNVTSISLTAGDWDVSGSSIINTNGNVTNYTGAISSTSGTLPSEPYIGGITQLRDVSGANDAQVLSISPVRFSLASTTTIYLVALCVFSTGTASGAGGIRARRMR